MEHERNNPFARLGRAFMASAILLASTFGTGAAYGQQNSQTDADILEAAELVRVSDLAFGSVIPGAAGGTVTINPSNNARSTTGTVTGVSSSFNAARFRANGSAGVLAIVVLPAATTITRQSGPEAMLVNNFTLDGGINLFGLLTVNLGPTGARDLDIGATLNVAPNQEPGIYDGTFQITTIYL